MEKRVGKTVSTKNSRKYLGTAGMGFFFLPGAGVSHMELRRFGGPWEFTFPVSLIPPIH